MSSRRRIPLAFILAVTAAAMAQPQPGSGARAPMGEERDLVERFDADGNGWLNRAERDAAREFLKDSPTPRPGRRPDRESAQSRQPGERLTPGEVQQYPDAPLYDTSILRTVFLEFEHDDWEQELDDFYGSDVEVPATLIVDGQRFEQVGVSFRGASSFFMNAPGTKRSFNISLDFIHDKQRLRGVRTLNLLNGHGDPSFMSTLLYSAIARERIPAPEANFVRVAVNGENWGIFVSAEQFNADFEKKHWNTKKGARWKVEGSPNGASGLDYIGDDVEAYKRKYDMKAGTDEDWQALIALCRTLSTTPVNELETAVRPMLDIEGALWFLAVENALVNSDGYWARASDFSLFRDPEGVFHIIPHDMNEAFSSGGPPGRGRRGRDGAGGPPGGRDGPPPDGQNPRPGAPRRGGRGGGPTLDPLVAMEDDGKPLRSRLLKVPSLRAQYLNDVKWIAEHALDPARIGPQIAQHRALIEHEMRQDGRLTSSFEAFDRATAPAAAEGPRPGLLGFVEQRRKYLLEHPEIADLERAGEPR